jgi:hypothetical protein
MNEARKQGWWSTVGFRKPEPARETDFADMGTAFGLDASMGPTPEADIRDHAPRDPFTDRLNRRSIL